MPAALLLLLCLFRPQEPEVPQDEEQEERAPSMSEVPP